MTKGLGCESQTVPPSSFQSAIEFLRNHPGPLHGNLLEILIYTMFASKRVRISL